MQFRLDFLVKDTLRFKRQYIQVKQDQTCEIRQWRLSVLKRKRDTL